MPLFPASLQQSQEVPGPNGISAVGFILWPHIRISSLAYGIPVGEARFSAYFWAFWWRDLLLGALLVLIVQQLFREIMAPLPGLSRLGVLACRWVIAVTIIVSITSSHFPNISIPGLMSATVSEFRLCACVLCILLLIFVTVIANKVGLSYRSRLYGISLGLGIFALAEFAYSTLTQRHGGAIIPLGIPVEVSQLIACCVWAYLFFEAGARSRAACLAAFLWSASVEQNCAGAGPSC